jgi:hypothetical protein
MKKKKLKKYCVFFKQTPCEQETIVYALSPKEAEQQVKALLGDLDILYDQIRVGWEVK